MKETHQTFLGKDIEVLKKKLEKNLLNYVERENKELKKEYEKTLLKLK